MLQRQRPPIIESRDGIIRRQCVLLRAWFVTVSALLLFMDMVAAGPFSELIVFGDSLSDVGNVQQATEELSFFVDPTPGPYYYNGRFSNGPVHSELLAFGLGLPALTHSRSGGDNFAHGGAKTTGTGFPDNIVVQDIDDQVTVFLGSQTVDPTALFVIWAGSNNVLDTDISDMSAPAEQLATDIGRLVSAGATQFLVFNLPPMGETPRFNQNAANRTTYNSRTTEFNDALATMLDGLETSNPALTLFRVDVAALVSEAIANPLQFGLTNVTQSAAPGLEPGATSYNTSLIAPNANEYLFWDDLHPTATVHAILSERVLSLTLMPGDYNRDGTVDTADYVLWRKVGGVHYTTEHYDVWLENFGELLVFGGAGVANNPVAEPASSPLVGFVVGLICVPRRRFR